MGSPYAPRPKHGSSFGCVWILMILPQSCSRISLNGMTKGEAHITHHRNDWRYVPQYLTDLKA